MPDTSLPHDRGRLRRMDTAMKCSITTTVPVSRASDGLGACVSRHALLPAILLAGLGLTGCQVDVGGQTLPSAYYLQDDIQYFPAGPEFKLSREAAALKAYKKELAEDESAVGYQPAPGP